jgi:hypothetical protein
MIEIVQLEIMAIRISVALIIRDFTTKNVKNSPFRTSYKRILQSKELKFLRPVLRGVKIQVMILGLMYLIVLAMVGGACGKRKSLENGYIFPIGIIGLVLGANAISNVFRVSVTSAGLICLVFFSLIFVNRLIFDRNFKTFQIQFLAKDFSFLVSVYLILSYVIRKIDFDFASQNFDAYYAIQDGQWLRTHSANSSSWIEGKQELLPLDWSSSTSDRYGVSYLFAIARIFPETETWASAQYLGLSLVIISFYTLYKTLFYIFESSVRSQYLKLATVAAFFSPFAIMQFQYFMFGQMLAIPVMYFLIYRLALTKDLKFHIMIIVIPLFFFIAYPAMFFLSLASISIYYTYIAFTTKISIRRFFNHFLFFFGATILGILLTSGSAVKSSVERFLIWTVTNTDTSRELTWSTLKIFSQFSGELFVPLVAGFIPYPSTSGINNIFLVFLWALGATVFLITWKFLKISTNASKSYVAVLCVHGTIFCLILTAFVSDKPYLIMKLTTWFFPFFFSIFVIWSSIVISEFKNIQGSLKFKQLSFSLLVLTIIGTSSFTYLARTTSWTNFPNIVRPSEYRAVSEAGKIIDKVLLISSPTIEESIWLSSQFGENVSSRALGLQEGGQSLGVGMSEDCTLPLSLRSFPNDSFIVFPRIKNDIAGNFIFRETPKNLNTRLQFQASSTLESAQVIIGSGTFPPINLGKLDAVLLPGNKFARWSSNQVCMGIFSSTTNSIEVTFEYISGPDLITKKVWIASNGRGEELTVRDKSSSVTVDLRLSKGWNLLQIKQPGCYLRKLSDRRDSRADDRSLCFLVGDIKFSRR